MTAPISAVITLSWRIIRRTWRRVMPIARSIPISRVRSNTVRTSVFTIPNRLTIDREREQHVEDVEDRVEARDLVVDELLRASAPSRSGSPASAVSSAAVFASVSPPRILTNVNRFCGCW